MPTKKKDLYLGRSLSDLNKMAEPPQKVPNARLFAKSSDKVFKNAQESEISNDEERAYVLYMKYMNCYMKIKKCAEYKANEKYFEALLSSKNFRSALEKSESLSASLGNRYEEKEAMVASEKLKQQKEEREKKRQDEEAAVAAELDAMETVAEEKDSPKHALDPLAISAHKLYSILCDKQQNVLIMDLRDENSFNESRIVTNNVLNVPADICKPGSTLAQIEPNLPETSKQLFTQRHGYDVIILVDWTGSESDLESVGPIRALKDALWKWDLGTPLKSEPLLVLGGYESFLKTYPTFTTNSEAVIPEAPVAEIAPIGVSLSDIDYDLDLNFMKSEAQLRQERLAVERAAEELRAKKEADEASKNLQSFSSTVAKQSVSNPTPLQPMIPDRATKPRPQSNIAAPAPKPEAPIHTVAHDMGDHANHVTNKHKPIAPSRELKPNNLKNRQQSTVTITDKNVAFTKNNINEEPAETNGTLSPSESVNKNENEVKIELQQIEKLKEAKMREAKETADLMRMKRKLERELDSLKHTRENIEKDNEKASSLSPKIARKETISRDAESSTGGINSNLKQSNNNYSHDTDHSISATNIENDVEEQSTKIQQLQEVERNKRQEKIDQEKLDTAKKQQEELANKQRQEAEQEKSRREQEEKRKEEERKKRERAAEERLIREKERLLKEKEDRERILKANLEKERKEQEEKARIQREKTEAERIARLKVEQLERNRPRNQTPGLKSGWEKRLDPSTGRYYFVDHTTQTTTWQPPEHIYSKSETSQIHKEKLKDEPSAGGGLRRSHSFTNISKLDSKTPLPSEKPAAAAPPETSQPVVNRTAKPQANIRFSTEVSAAKVRNLNPTWGAVQPGLTGLRNLGNTCYMNSIIQCLSNTSVLHGYFLTDSYKQDVNKDNFLGTGGVVAEEFAVIIKALWAGQYKSIYPRDFKGVVGRLHPLFSGFDQQDSQELLAFVMDGLHEDLNRVKKRVRLPEQDNDGIADLEAARRAWEWHLRVNQSVIVDFFQGQLKSTVECLSCRKRSVTFDAFMYLTLPVPNSSRCSLRDCLLQYCQEERLTGESRWHCPRCKTKRDATKRIVIWKLPRMLIIHLKRFYTQGMWRHKITSFVDFPLEGLDMNKYISGPAERGAYSLYGVSNHYGGTLEGGHYTAYAKERSASKWHKFDDHEVFPISNSDIKSPAAYILFYSSREL